MQAQLADILSVARPRNLSLGVTGALLAHHGYFAQVLEGSRANIDVLMDYIGRDPRHEAIRVVRIVEAPERRFANWSMAQAAPTPALGAFFSDRDDEVAIDPEGLIAVLWEGAGALLRV